MLRTVAGGGKDSEGTTKTVTVAPTDPMEQITQMLQQTVDKLQQFQQPTSSIKLTKF